MPVPILPDGRSFQNKKGKDENIKIGLLIGDNKSLAAVYAAEMAIMKANRNGGFDGKSFRLVVRSMEGPWGTGSTEAVNLIFEDDVVAIIGSHDGRNAHIVEQVTAKAHIVFISAWASDPTLAQAFVPWYFNCVPNDLQQASALLEEIYFKRKFRRIAFVSDNSYDSKMALNSFIKKSKITGITEPLQFFYDNSSTDLNGVLENIFKADIECIILCGNSLVSEKIIQQLRQQRINLKGFGTLSIMSETGFSDQQLKNYEGVVLISSGYWFNSQGLIFRKEFQQLYGYQPGPDAAYAYDAVNLLIETVRNAGTDRAQIHKFLSKINYNGVSGPIQFDERGNRVWTAVP